LKKRIIALIACILMTGTAGAFAKTVDSSKVDTSKAASNGKTVTSIAKTSPIKTATNATVSAVLSKGSAAKTTPSAVKSAAVKTASGGTASCPQNTAPTALNCAAGSNSANCTKDISQWLNALNCSKNGNSVNGLTAINSSNCKTNNCISLINYLYGVYCKTGSCPTTTCPTSSGSGTTSSNGNTSSSNSGSSSSNASPSSSNGNTNSSSSSPSSSNSSTGSTSSTPTTSSSNGNTSSVPVSNNGNYSQFQNEVVRLVNKERAANGLKALTVNSQVTKSATLKSEDMAKLNYFDHTSPTYGSPFDMMKKLGITYRAAGENIAMGQKSPEQVMQGWMNSPGHRANILNASFTQIGVGIAKNAQGQYVWTQQFIG
jgi:uncharacterized YkwD family protein